jgi:hypothetical protein
LDLKLEFPTDRGNFQNITISSNLKKQIVSYGPCKSSINIIFSDEYKTMKYSRYFSKDYYYMTTKAGVKVPRMWLCYSLVLNKVYCESCWLFVDRKNHKLKLNLINSMNDWQHLTK